MILTKMLHMTWVRKSMLVSLTRAGNILRSFCAPISLSILPQYPITSERLIYAIFLDQSAPSHVNFVVESHSPRIIFCQRPCLISTTTPNVKWTRFLLLVFQEVAGKCKIFDFCFLNFNGILSIKNIQKASLSI